MLRASLKMHLASIGAEFLAERRQKAREGAGDVKEQLKNMKAVAEAQKTLILQGGEAFFELEIDTMIMDAIDEHAKDLEAKDLAKEMAKVAGEREKRASLDEDEK